jgi:hypothetical protein
MQQDNKKNMVPDAWPRGMRVSVAATYVGLKESTFSAKVKSGEMVQPAFYSGRLPIWLKEHLDVWLDEQSGISHKGDGTEWLKAV